VIRQEADLHGILLPGGVRAGRNVPQAQSDLLGHLGAASQRETARHWQRTPVLQCNSGGAPNANTLATRLLADFCVDFGGGEAVEDAGMRAAEE
jgi:hypothetical protein